MLNYISNFNLFIQYHTSNLPNLLTDLFYFSISFTVVVSSCLLHLYFFKTFNIFLMLSDMCSIISFVYEYIFNSSYHLQVKIVSFLLLFNYGSHFARNRYDKVRMAHSGFYCIQVVS